MFKRRPPKIQQGFTLIEMLLVVTLMSMTSLAVFQAITNGIKIWDSGHKFSLEEDVGIFLAKLEEDLQNTLNYSQIPLRGRQQSFAFAAFVQMKPDAKASSANLDVIQQIGKVEYLYDVHKDHIIRRQAGYSDALRTRYDPERVLAAKILSLRFSYIYLDEQKLVVRGLSDGPLPYALRIEMEYPGTTGAVQKLTRVIQIPAGQIDLAKDREIEGEGAGES